MIEKNNQDLDLTFNFNRVIMFPRYEKEMRRWVTFLTV